MKDWVIARAPHLCRGDERAFVEFPPEPLGQWLTFSSLLDADDCAALDDGAYRDARTWYRSGSDDPTMSSGVSLGRSFELPATIMLVKHRRAKLILERLLADDPAAAFHLRGVGDEWRSAARSLGAPVVEESPDSAPVDLPGLRLERPSRAERALASLASGMGRGNPDVAFLGTPHWSRPYYRSLLRQGGVSLINPGARALMDVFLGRRLVPCSWLAATAPVMNEVGPLDDQPLGMDDPWFFLREKYLPIRESLAAWARMGRDAGIHTRVAVATQDVTPPTRAYLLGIKASGGAVLTLEHGISGAYRGQVHSVADTLGAWGEPQATYHRQFGPPTLRVDAVGWARLEAVYSECGPDASATWDLLFFSQPSAGLSSADWPEDNLRALRMVDAYAGAHPDRRVAVKMHPSTAAYGWAAPSVTHAALVTSESLGLIRTSRVVATSFSTTGIESMVMGRPLVQVQREGVLGPSEWISKSGAAVAAGTAEEFEVAVETLLADSAAYGSARTKGLAYAREFILGVDRPGSAERRFVDIVLGLAGRQSGERGLARD